MVSIKGLSKPDVLAALYNRARPQGMGFLHYTPEDMTKEQAELLLQQTTYGENGMVIKMVSSKTRRRTCVLLLPVRRMAMDVTSAMMAANSPLMLE